MKKQRNFKMKLETLEKDCFYHIYNRGNNGDTIFKNDENYFYFLRLLEKYLIKKTSIYAYCLMKNHYHILLKINDDEKITQSFSNFFNAYAKAFNKATNRTGSLFEKHFKRIKVNNEDYLKTLVVYIHTNPQHHQFVDSFKNYEHSSYKAIALNKDTFVESKETIELFGSIDNFEHVHMQKSDLLAKKYTLE